MSNDWRSRSKFTRRDGLRVAGAILGLMAGIILILWIVGKILRHH